MLFLRRLLSFQTPSATVGTGSFTPSGKRIVTLLEGSPRSVGPELIRTVERVFQAASFPVQFERVDVDEEDLAPTPTNDYCTVPEEVIRSIQKTRVCLKGTFLASPLRGHNSFDRALAEEFKLFAHVSHVHTPKMSSGMEFEQDIDFAVVRENTEGEYRGLEHELQPGVIENIKVVTEEASERIARFALEMATRWGLPRVISVHKANIMKMSDGLFLDCCNRLSKEYPHLKMESLIVDNASMQMILHPQNFDNSVIVTTNLYGSIMNGIAAALAGGMLAGYNIGLSDVVVYEQGIRHAQRDISNKNLVNPIGMLRSATFLLRHIGEAQHADDLTTALDNILQEGKVLPRDIGGRARTSQVADEVLRQLDNISASRAN